MTDVDRLLGTTTVTSLRPSYEGANIGTIIGFKHVNYLVEQAVLDHFRAAGAPAGRLYEDHGVGFDVVELDSRLQTALIVDDLVEAEVTPKGFDGTGIRFAVTLHVERDGVPKKAVTSKARIALRADERGSDRKPVPDALRPFVIDRITATGQAEAGIDEAGIDVSGKDGDAVIAALTEGRNAYGWRYRIPYFYCHFFERMQMSGYLRQMEEVVDLFLADRGLAIKQLLDERNWIPAVTRSHVRILGETLMEEELYTVYSVSDVFKDLLYTSTMDCYVVRDGVLVHTATGSITHAYGTVDNGRDGQLVTFDERVQRALHGAATA